jgi:DMSO reductase family type II enzyme heme b subunit
MFDTISMIAAPAAMQPGGYIAYAYSDRREPPTPTVDLAVEEQAGRWTIELRWDCPNPVTSVENATDLFTDAAALLVPGTPDASWLTMGEPGEHVEGVLWRADRSRLFRIRAEGLGSVERATPPGSWSTTSNWENGRWSLKFDLADWPVLDRFGRVGIAIWRGENQDRGGLKSVTSAWIALR